MTENVTSYSIPAIPGMAADGYARTYLRGYHCIQLVRQPRCARMSELDGKYTDIQPRPLLDLYVAAEEGIALNPGQCKGVPTGVSLVGESLNGPRATWTALAFTAQEMSREGIFILGGILPLDASNSREIVIPLMNTGDSFMYLRPGDLIAQLRLVQTVDVKPEWS